MMSAYKYIFGPVPSRRLGISLGIDLVPHKTCTLNCVYCECGRTTNLTLERKEYNPADKAVEELDDYLYGNPAPDYITFSGAGEPTLNSKIGDIIEYIKKKYPEINLAVLTNGTLFFDKDVRSSLKKADLVMPSLDAATQNVFLKINRPKSDLNVHAHIDGLKKFRKEFKGEIWLEILILPGYNDQENELAELKKAIHEINPDMLQLNTLDRPGAVAGLQPASEEKLRQIADYFDFPKTEIIAKSPKRKKAASYRKDTESAILQTIARRPCTAEDLSEILGIHLNEVNKYLSQLELDSKVETKKEARGDFYVKKRSPA